MARSGWNWLEWLYISGNGWKWLEMSGMAGNCWKWLEMARMAGNGLFNSLILKYYNKKKCHQGVRH